MYQTIRSKIIEVINNNADKIAAAYRTDRSDISAFPAALIIPGALEASYHQTSPGSNKEIYDFTIRVIYPFTEGQDTADIALEQAIDELLTIFRDRKILGNAADWVVPVSVNPWGYMDRAGGTARVAELRIQAVRHIDPSNP